MNELLKKSALELADMLAAGEVTSVELTQASLDRIHALNDEINAFLFVDDDGALAAARDVDERRAAGEKLGRLAGVPIAVKDALDAILAAAIPVWHRSGWRELLN